MKVLPIKTGRISHGSVTLEQLLEQSLDSLADGSIVVVTSKIVSLCENSVVPIEGTDREALIRQQADLFLPKSVSKYRHHFTIKNNTLIASAGIDESNSDGYYVLWPRGPWASAEMIRRFLKQKFNVTNVGVIITDSTSMPLRLGTAGIALAHSGFAALRSYIGQPDLFGRPQQHSRANIAAGLAAAAVVTMGEGNEQTPLAVLSDLSFVEFQDRPPTPDEIDEVNLSLEDDLFAPFLDSVQWRKGKEG